MLPGMDPTAAEQRLKNMVAWDCAPCLDQDDIDLLLAACRRTDTEHREITDTDWVPTYFLDWAAREAWAWKAGAAADYYRLVTDGTELDRNQVYDHCIKMFNLYDKKASGRPCTLRASGNLVVDRLAFNKVPWWWSIQGN